MIKNITNLGDAALYCDFGNDINKEINTQVINYFKNIRQKKFLGITNIAPSYNKLIVTFDLSLTNYKSVKTKIENLELKSLLQIKDNDSFSIVFTKIIFSHPSFLNKSFTVPLGSEDGITKNQLVFSSKGFLGKVARVMSNYSEVITLENINFNLIVEVGDKKFKGILKGNGYGHHFESISLRFLNQKINLLKKFRFFLLFGNTL